MGGNWGVIAGVAGLIVSIITIVSVFISIGQYKGKTDQKIDSHSEKISDISRDIGNLKKEFTVTTTSITDLKTEFASFSGEMRATMQYIKSDLKDIKEKVNAKEK